MEIYRITHKKWTNKLVASGRAARWNSNNIELIYAASSRSLACLENVVHRQVTELTELFAVMVIYVPDQSAVENLLVHSLPDNWHLAEDKHYNICQHYGDEWVWKAESLLLKVPSAIVKNEYNYLINPNHKEFDNVKIVGVEPFYFDPRIK